jgi:NAD(P)-dependent dehydrogenase (short-subunit alcohol dehydrogenase family)
MSAAQANGRGRNAAPLAMTDPQCISAAGIADAGLFLCFDGGEARLLTCREVGAGAARALEAFAPARESFFALWRQRTRPDCDRIEHETTAFSLDRGGMSMTNNWQGKVALVTGGASGIGEACVHAFAARGCSVVVADLNLDAARAAAARIGSGAIGVAVNVADAVAVEAMVRTTLDHFGGLDIAVNNAGIGGDLAPTGDYTPEGWRKVIDVNLSGVFYCMRYEIPAMLQRGGGSIVNMASILGSVGFANSPAYVAAKHGVLGLTKAAALEYAAQNIRVNSVGPAFIQTPLLSVLDEPTTEFIKGLHPVKRLGQPEEVAALVCFLASDEASFITGSYHLVDGGYTAQ